MLWRGEIAPNCGNGNSVTMPGPVTECCPNDGLKLVLLTTRLEMFDAGSGAMFFNGDRI